ncbi:MAG: hypothetical protein LUH82_04835 [Clostridiales bacterium]|nr:hypothetical protein [Clostridiales bacterium]
MKDLIECCLSYNAYEKLQKENECGHDICEMDRKALMHVLPGILKKELTERQRICLKMRYVNDLRQDEISKKLHLSQPTVSRHISLAREIVNNRLGYCVEALKELDSEWLKCE